MENQSVPAASQVGVTKPNDGPRMVDIPLSPDAKITVERREQIVLIGINRPKMFNRIDPEAFYGLATAYYGFDNDSTLRAAVLFGHGEHFSRGNDVEAFSVLAKSGQSFKLGEDQIDPLGRAQKLSKPLVAVAHGDTSPYSYFPDLSGNPENSRVSPAVTPFAARDFEWPDCCSSQQRIRTQTLTLKFVCIRHKGKTRVRLSGELRLADLDDVHAEIARVAPPVIVDLEEVDLADIHGVRCLNACQAHRVQLENCAPYIREWMFQEKLGEEK